MRMATPGGVASAASSPGSEADLALDERRRKRRLSNRESARRSRARKQRQLDELAAEAEALCGRNGGMASAVRAAVRGCAAVEAENAVLRAQVLELGARLQSLTQLLRHMNSSFAGYNAMQLLDTSLQPLMASPDMHVQLLQQDQIY